MTTLYGLKNCDTCKKATKWLDRFGVAYAFVDYRDNRSRRRHWWSGRSRPAAGTRWSTSPRPPGGSCRTNRKSPGSEAEWKLLLREYPQLIRRPVVVTDDGVMTQGFSDNGFKRVSGSRNER